MSLDEMLQAWAADPFVGISLTEFALHLAADEYPDLDVAECRDQLDEYAAAIHSEVDDAETLEEAVAILSEYLFVQEGFAGNTDDYYDPLNSYLNDVLERKLGLPIALSLLAAAVGERCGLNIVGVGLPGHFIAKAIGDDGEEVLFDPFHDGQILDRAGCAALIEAVTGQPFAATEEMLSATPPGLIAQRMLMNLKGAYLRKSDFVRAARVIGRLVVLMPNDPTQRRDLGVSLIHAGKPGLAVDHLEAYLAAVPMADDRDAVREFLRDAWREVGRWN